MEFEINPKRFEYILELYKISKEELITQLNRDRKRDLLNLETLNNILERKEKINIKLLKRIDKIFDQGLTWYISKRDLPEKKSNSIFFRKDTFNSELNFESRRVVNKYEELKFEIRTLCKYINFNPERLVKKYKLSDDPKIVAKEMRYKFDKAEEKLNQNKQIKKTKEDKEYLKMLIRIIEEFNIFVFELTENWNKKEKVSFNGFFISPNIIVIKRQKYLRREIFSLIHEFAHCLLESEEIDDIVDVSNFKNSNEIEKWCSTFTYYLLLNNHKNEFEKLTLASLENNFYEDKISELYNKTHLSTSAFYTRLRIENKISQDDYDKIIFNIKESIRRIEEEEKIKRKGEKQLAKELGIKIRGGPQIAIESNLFKEIVKLNYYEGYIDENVVREHLKTKKSIEEVIF